MIERVLTACEELNGGELDRLMALLRRFEMEAALEQARLEAPQLAKPEFAPALHRPVIDMEAFEAALAEAA